ncbi:MAG TPA: RDD family protein [Pyrinomonadaceae bacterium]|nr:RDD family protein [Pyrinomonadaceae bacterium]
MNAKVEKNPAIPRMRAEEVVVDFDAERLQAPFLLRCGALFIDYILLMVIPVLSLIVGRLFGVDGTKLLTSEISNTGWLVMVLLGLTNFIIFPMFSGQSLGKMMTGIRIVKSDGTAASFGRILIRHTVGYAVTVLSAGIGFILAAVTLRGRALHDYFAGTIVIYGNRRVRSHSNE